MDFGLFNTWNALYAGGKVPWDPDYSGGKLLEEEASVRNWAEVEAVETWAGTTSGLGEATFPSRRAWILSLSC
jgi:hypothetical protein